MKQTHTLGPTPCEEECAQVGSEGYAEKARQECQLYREQLKRIITAAGKVLPEDCKLVITSNDHDAGEYYEVGFKFNPDNEDHYQFLLWLEGELPDKWDAEAQVKFNYDWYDFS